MTHIYTNKKVERIKGENLPPWIKIREIGFLEGALIKFKDDYRFRPKSVIYGEITDVETSDLLRNLSKYCRTISEFGTGVKVNGRLLKI